METIKERAKKRLVQERRKRKKNWEGEREERRERRFIRMMDGSKAKDQENFLTPDITGTKVKGF